MSSLPGVSFHGARVLAVQTVKWTCARFLEFCHISTRASAHRNGNRKMASREPDALYTPTRGGKPRLDWLPGSFRAMILVGSTSDNVSSGYPNRALLLMERRLPRNSARRRDATAAPASAYAVRDRKPDGRYVNSSRPGRPSRTCS
jgi:hypothetical protein